MLTSQSVALITTNAIFVTAAGMGVGLRLYIRKHQTVPLKIDDYLIVAAWVFALALAITNIIGVPRGGFGVPYEDLTDYQLVEFLKILFVLQFWYIISVSLVKLSVLCFYGRMFSIVRFPLSVKICICISAGWLVSFLAATFFQVWPISCNWGDCVPLTNYPIMYLLCSVTDIAVDICTLCLPITFLIKLQMNKGQKVGLVGIFGLGIFCVIASVARLVYTIAFLDGDPLLNTAPNYDSAVVNIIMWSGIEACCSIICANLPCYSPLLRFFRSITNAMSSMRSMFSSNGHPTRIRDTKHSHDALSSTEYIVGTGTVETVIRGSETSESNQRDLEMGTIKVETKIQAVPSGW